MADWLYTLITVVAIIIWDLCRTWGIVHLTAKKVKKDREEEKHGDH